jgi:hypothetical protein
MANGIYGIKPIIKKAKFGARKLYIALEDGREISIPKKYFSFLKGNVGRIFISDGDTLIFDKADEVIHIEEILGRNEDYKYKA